MIKGRVISILQLTDSFLPIVGGKQLAVHNLAVHLKKFGCNCLVITNKITDKIYNSAPYQIKLFPKSPKILPILFKLIWFVFKRWHRNVDIIHAHRLYPAGYIAVILGKIYGIPSIVTPHGDDILTVAEIGYGITLKEKYKKKCIYTLKQTDNIIVFNVGLKKKCIQLGADANKIRIIPLGVDLKHNTFNSFDINNGKKLIAVGRNHRVKDYNTLLLAMAIVTKRDPSITCTIVGKKTNDLKTTVKFLSLVNNVYLVDEQNELIDKGMPDGLKKLYLNSDIYISSSLSESFSLTILEAMATGLAVIATDTVGSQGLIKDKSDGIIVPVNNPHILAQSILELAHDNELRSKIGANAKSKANSMKYKWSDISMKHLCVYEQAISNQNTNANTS